VFDHPWRDLVRDVHCVAANSLADSVGRSDSGNERYNSCDKQHGTKNTPPRRRCGCTMSIFNHRSAGFSWLPGMKCRSDAFNQEPSRMSRFYRKFILAGGTCYPQRVGKSHADPPNICAFGDPICHRLRRSRSTTPLKARNSRVASRVPASLRFNFLTLLTFLTILTA
jgi:hypothetical protein